MKNDRRMATRPHYKHTAERDFLLSSLFTFITGAMLGAVIVIGVMS